MESLADTQLIDLGIRGVQRRMKGVRYQTLVTHVIGRLAAIGIAVWIFLQFLNFIDFSNTEKFPEGFFTDSLTLVFVFFENIAIVLFSLPLLLFMAFAPEDGAALLLGMRAFITEDLFNGVDPPGGISPDDFFGGSSMFAGFGNLFNSEITAPLKPANRATILTIGLVLFGISVLAFLFRADMRSAASAFIAVQFVVFYGNVQLLFDTSSFSFSPTNKFGELFSNNVVLFALASYLFLEIALQISYISQILSPTQSRNRRVLRALDRLKEFRLGVTSEPSVATKVEEGEEEGEEGEEGKSLKIGTTGSSIARKYGLAGLTYFMEKASDSLFAKPGGQKDKLTARLQRYHDGLVHSDSRVDEKLVGVAVVVQPLMTLVYVLVSVIFRVGIMILGLYAILNPDVLLFVLRYPPSIYNSLELLQPEGVVLLLIPIVVFILLLTSLIGFIQERFSSRFETELEPVLDELEYLKGEETGVIVEGEPEPISEEELFYRQLAQEFEDTED
ncbi:MAG: hypothetical protein ACTSUR_03265 [Candidatus Heimdallarchaeaceae archaeon]